MPEFEFDLKKLELGTAKIDELVRRVGRAFETQIRPSEIRFYSTDHIERDWVKRDEDIITFMKKKSQSRMDEKLIKCQLPERLVPARWQPKKENILITGKQLSKYFGDEPVSTRQVEFSLKLFDCGHFRLKQTLPGSGASPYWVIFEGRWTESPKGFKLEHLFRYPWQNSKRQLWEFAIEAVQAPCDSNMAYAGEAENQLNGWMPAIVGEDNWCWVELVREADVQNVPKTRFNEEDDDIEPPAPAMEEPEAAAPTAGEPPEKGDCGVRDAKAAAEEEEYEDTEPMWPMLLGLTLFLTILAICAYLWWEERRGPDSGSSEYEEF